MHQKRYSFARFGIAGRASFGEVYGTVLGFKFHIELLIYQLLPRAAVNPFSAQLMVVLGIAPAQGQDLALGLLELHQVHQTSSEGC